MTKRKNNNYGIHVFPYELGLYVITMNTKDQKREISFPYATACGLSEVQQMFFDLTDAQCEEMFNDSCS